MEKTAYIHQVETCGTVDGPGLRYVVFFQGCNLRCKYCHNPDTWRPRCGTESTVPELVEDVLNYKSYMQFSGGGFTACGGEPLLQAEFVAELFRQLKKNGIHTCLDTSGSIELSKAEELLSVTDLVLLDIKSLNPKTYKELTGADIENSLKFAKYLSKHNIPTWIRHVVIPGLTDEEEDIRKLAEFVKSMKNVEKVELLPFHKMGEEKWENLDPPYQLKDIPIPSAEKMKALKDIISAALP
ncbi:MAG: pyruvate formate-lyase-activating protein [Oscillospiraceae bacterium]|nr:pyruvate formate-lyase-activating protein [Oscillospiraceae bacterium]